MISGLLFAYILVGLLSSTCCQAWSSDQLYMGNIPAPIPFEFRDAVLDDSNDFTTVIVDAFYPSPEWQYIFQFADEHPGYTWHCQRQGWRRLFENAAEFGITTKVIAVPDRTSRTGSRVVSLSVWQFNKTSKSSSSNYIQPLFLPTAATLGGFNCSEHLDINKTRTEPWEKANNEALSKYIDNAYERHAYLGTLATHPQWDGNGFAATHLRWGLALADAWGTPATLIGTAAGHPLYRSFGYEDIHNITLERLDGHGVLWHEVMVRQPRPIEG